MKPFLFVWLLTTLLMGINGPFTLTERFEQLEDCLRAKIYYHERGMWAGGGKKGKEEHETIDYERGRA